MHAEQPTLWDAAAAATARLDGIDRAERNMNRDWSVAARAAIGYCAVALPNFTADDVLVRLQQTEAPPTHNLSALGPVFLAAAKAGEIRKTGELRRSRIARRHRDLTVWQAVDDKPLTEP